MHVCYRPDRQNAIGIAGGKELSVGTKRYAGDTTKRVGKLTLVKNSSAKVGLMECDVMHQRLTNQQS